MSLDRNAIIDDVCFALGLTLMHTFMRFNSSQCNTNDLRDKR